MASGRERSAFTLVELPVASGRERSAFTLVELLVIVSIIALLITILMPSLSRAMDLGRRAACLANQRHLAVPLGLYYTDNRARFPASPSWQNAALNMEIYRGNDGHGDFSQPGGLDGYLKGFFGMGILYQLKYVQDPQAYYCPSLTKSPMLSYPSGWDPAERPDSHRNPALDKWRFAGYYYRIFGQTQPGVDIDQKFIDELQGMDPSGDELIVADIFLDILGRGRAPHIELSGIVGGFGDGHAAWFGLDENEYSRLDKAAALGQQALKDEFVCLYFQALGRGDFSILDDAGYDP